MHLPIPLGLAIAITLASPCSNAEVLITEFMASNQEVLLDEDGDSSDWLEIFNNGPVAVELGGHHLSDDPNEPQKWLMPAHSLAPNGFLLVFASSSRCVDRI